MALMIRFFERIFRLYYVVDLLGDFVRLLVFKTGVPSSRTNGPLSSGLTNSNRAAHLSCNMLMPNTQRLNVEKMTCKLVLVDRELGVCGGFEGRRARVSQVNTGSLTPALDNLRTEIVD